MEIISRKEAKALGLKRYFTGKPCKNGHVAERLLTYNCVVCLSESAKRWAKEHRALLLERKRLWRLAKGICPQTGNNCNNREYWRKHSYEYYHNNLEKQRRYSRLRGRKRYAAKRLLKALGFQIDQADHALRLLRSIGFDTGEMYGA